MQVLINYLHIPDQKISIVSSSGSHMLRFQDTDNNFKNKINAAKPFCLAVSSLSANKNFKSLSNAISKIEFKDYRMLIAGGASSALRYSREGDAVTYIGYVSNEELKYLYANASLFIFPSFYEGFGLPPLEAMVLGCPVAASNTSSIPEVLGDACAYFNPFDEDDIAKTIQELIENKSKLHELKQKGLAKANTYIWSDNAVKMVDVIKKIE